MVSFHDLKSEVAFKAVRSRGPGGQNVNRVSSAAQLHWPYLESAFLNAEQKDRIRKRLASIINSENEIYLRSDEFRDLERNKSRCLDKLLALIKQALHVPKKRKATKPTFASKQRRHESKNRRGETKRMRKKVDY